MTIRETRSEVDRAKRAIKAAQENLTHLQKKLDREESQCGHIWGDAEGAHIYHKAYTIPGDEPGTMGVDFRGPCHVPSRTEARWKRTCLNCGKVEYTTRVEKSSVVTPIF